jgi:hypothetical protein
VSKLRQSARGQSCQIRLPGICTYNDEETVLAHVRLAGITGGALKAPDLLGAWACSECHRVTEKEKADDYIQRCFLEGVIRTQYALIKLGIVKT